MTPIRRNAWLWYAQERAIRSIVHRPTRAGVAFRSRRANRLLAAFRG